MPQYYPRTIVLKDIDLWLRKRIPQYALERRELEKLGHILEASVKEAYEELIIKYRRPFFVTEPNELTIKYPINWWEAFKDRWFNAWLKSRFPIKYKIYDIEKALAFPNIEVPRNCGRYFKMVTINCESEFYSVEDSVEDLKYFSCTKDLCPGRQRICENPKHP